MDRPAVVAFLLTVVILTQGAHAARQLTAPAPEAAKGEYTELEQLLNPRRPWSTSSDLLRVAHQDASAAGTASRFWQQPVADSCAAQYSVANLPHAAAHHMWPQSQLSTDL